MTLKVYAVEWEICEVGTDGRAVETVAKLSACDVKTYEVALKETAHTLESWVELARAIADVMRKADANEDAQ